MTLSRTIITITLSILLFIVGLYFWNQLFILALPIVNNVDYIETTLGMQFRNSLVFSLTIGLIPVATILIWKYAQIVKQPQKVLTAVIITISIFLFIFIRREMIILQARNLQPFTVLDYSNPSNPQTKTIGKIIPLSIVKFELFAFIGLVVGSAISYLSLRQK